MRNLRRFVVTPSLPPRLERLRELAYNLWWSWNHDAEDLFLRLDSDLWVDMHRNPVALLGAIDQNLLEAAAQNDAYLAHLDDVSADLQRYLSDGGWFARAHRGSGAQLAYFSAEFGLTECIPTYSGGLGVLAGDHLKSASDLGLPLVAVGLAYSEGYFRQQLNDDGWQTERYPVADFTTLPMRLVTKGGTPLVFVEYPGRTVAAQIWRVDVGRVPLYLLDTNVEQNELKDRAITARLYGGDDDMRIRQEMMLGIGGMRALGALGIDPAVCHMNEGHSAFLALERARQRAMSDSIPFSIAAQACSAGSVFTTHTPVPAGHDMFHQDLVEYMMGPYLERLGLDPAELLALGRLDPGDKVSPLSMTVLAIRLSDRYNAVSELHGRVARKMWQKIWPEVHESEVPIRSITNGVHTPSWISREIAALYDRYLGPRWSEEPSTAELWQRVEDIPDAELWRVHERQRQRLVIGVRRLLRAQAERRGAPPGEIAESDEALDPDALTLGFARRFATYKRAVLILRDVERLARILGNKDRPVQVLFAGKAHPRDEAGKELIREIVHATRLPSLKGRVVFLEDYDIGLGRLLVGGVDVWLNTPRRPLEASGTSGMKAAANGALQLSVLDGWWSEAWQPGVGWAIGRGEEWADSEYGDQVEANALYDLLEKEVVPAFYERDLDGVPRSWIACVKRSVRSIVPAFNTNRMVKDYAESLYLPAFERHTQMKAETYRGAMGLFAWKERVRAAWPAVQVAEVRERDGTEVAIGGSLGVEAVVQLGGLQPSDIVVETFTGKLDGRSDLGEPDAIQMALEEDLGGGRFRYAGQIRCRATGAHAYTVRVVPYHPALSHKLEVGLVRWA
ncbi:MAG: alpha-glucan family phosphorylase [Deltaproteobacteria bacterium]|nr:alpha-glucan family phosphorylase [Deltaproteobacteria bacterium]